MNGRSRLVLALVLTVLVAYTARLMYLQLAMAEEFTARSEQNATQQKPITPLRGRILASDGTVLADDRIAYDLMYRGGKIPDWSRLKRLLGLEGEPRPPDPNNPDEVRNGAVLAWNIPDKLVPAIEERVAGHPNLYLRQRVERTYPTNLAAQTVGYTTQADPERYPGYTVNDLVGVMGIEKSYEKALHGTAGARLVEVDNVGNVVRSTLLWPAQPGQDVTLTIDPQVQRLAEDTLKSALKYVNQDRKRTHMPLAKEVHGALLAVDPKNGDILAMASAPTFDENLFTHLPVNAKAVNAILQDSTNRPLENRAIQAYPPASTFKIITSYTMLQDGFVTPQSKFDCAADIRYGGVTFHNWATFDKGPYDIAQGIADSCNTFFWNAALTTPGFSSGWNGFMQDEVDNAYKLGYGKPVGVGLPAEESGRVPDLQWVHSQPQYKHGWLPGYTLNTIIGQGDTLATPVQLAQLISTVAEHGMEAKPHLVEKVGDTPVKPQIRHIDGSYWDTLIHGMRLAFTAFPEKWFLGPSVFPDNVSVAGKTGTAQTSRGDGWTHAWFMGFSPVKDPKIAIVVFLEYGGASSYVSVPVARDFLAGYWKLHGVEVHIP
ncbi:MAG TPA: penicillin-binding transpeptidase domain-containing protein [Trueperaceae bacterium]|nr:penicillin-binding transpeptidase domain-containing protein [Trueperaceae bacterium]